MTTGTESQEAYADGPTLHVLVVLLPRLPGRVGERKSAGRENAYRELIPLVV